MLKIGVLGAGHLGKIHLKCLQLTEGIYDLVGFYDVDAENAAQVSKDLKITSFDSVDALIDAVDVVDIVTPTPTHFDLAAKVIRKGKHVFIEKPLTHTVDEARELLQLKEEYGVKVQVGHVERFNPALLSIADMELNPMFIEGHRLSTFNPRGTDVSVVLDLMIHDIDIVLSLVNSEVVNVSASGVSVVSETPDISNARIEFANGCVANLTASRLSLKQMRKVRFFQSDAYISLDFLEKQAQIVRLYDEKDVEEAKKEMLMELPTAKGKKFLDVSMPEIEPVNAIKLELETFAESIVQNTEPRVSIEDGYQALELAHQIIKKIKG
ncbi:MAG: putative dehydrogenase [Saprospiraceae bacterium]|jgi:predicted dehydrogenase